MSSLLNRFPSFAMLLRLLFLVVPALACKPTITVPTHLLDLVPPKLLRLLPVKLPPAPALSVLVPSSPEIEGSGLDDDVFNGTLKKSPKKMRCGSTAMVEIQTSFHWNPSKLNEYTTYMERELRLLQKYSQTPVSSFGGHMTRNIVQVMTARGSFYGQRFFVDGITSSCSRVNEFIRKAVSWSTTIPKATVACRCDPEVIVYKA